MKKAVRVKVEVAQLCPILCDPMDYMHLRIHTFELWCWRKLSRVPWTARRSNQSILKDINPEYSLEELMLKLKVQYLGDLIQIANSLEKNLMLGKTEGRKRRWQQRMRRLECITDSMDVSLANSRRWWSFKHHFTSVWDECNCIYEHSLPLPFFGIGMKTDFFQSCGYCWVFQTC